MKIETLAISGSYLFAGADQSGVWRRSLSELITGINNKTEYLPFKFSLSQNYPNPFNPTTTISYQLPEKSIVTLKVYDILGREIAELVNETKDAGNHEATFDASNLSSGIYYYQIKAGDFVQSKKILLIK
ncbi:MAG: T9SS type A sorting domain-containing protein [Ignavibacteriales bacterium]|nr:T9SS type A sorting domain-containing protein [Ignavibacteriales bacterium]